MYYTCGELLITRQKEEYRLLLEQGGLTYEECGLQIGAYDGEKLIGGISLDDNCIKLLKVLDEYKGQDISSILISEIIKCAFEKNIFHLFVYTKPENSKQFNSQGFYTIFETEDVLFLENEKYGIDNYQKSLEKQAVFGKNVASLVMNLNPVTLGHEYLISKASEENDVVHLIIVKEDKSVFPYDVRLKIIKEVVRKYKNVIVHEGSDYCISSATFPTYFIKSKDDVPSIYAELDVNIFGKYIAKPLRINRRYIGEEPYSKTTNMYNQVIKKVLPNYGIDIIEVPRKSVGNEIVSASKVREYLKLGKIEEARRFLPKATYEFLKSREGEKIIENIKVSNNRH